MKRVITGAGIGGYRTLLGICTTYSLLLLVALYILLLKDIKIEVIIQRCYLLSAVMPLLLMTLFMVKLLKNYYFAIFGYRISAKNLVLPINDSTVAKFNWSNIKKIYKEETSKDEVSFDIEYVKKDSSAVSKTITISIFKSKRFDTYTEILRLHELNKSKLKSTKAPIKHSVVFLSPENIALCIAFHVCFYLLGVL